MAMSHNRKGYLTKECLRSTFNNKVYSQLFNKGNYPDDTMMGRAEYYDHFPPRPVKANPSLYFFGRADYLLFLQ